MGYSCLKSTIKLNKVENKMGGGVRIGLSICLKNTFESSKTLVVNVVSET